MNKQEEMENKIYQIFLDFVIKMDHPIPVCTYAKLNCFDRTVHLYKNGFGIK